MIEGLEIYLSNEGIRLYSKKGKKKPEVYLPKPVKDLSYKVRRFLEENRLNSRPLIIFVEEEMLFFKKFSLPLQTVNLKEAVGYQLSALTPFKQEVLYDFTVYRSGKEQEITLYAIKSEEITPYIQQLAEDNFHILGVYPVSQRFVTNAARNKDWGLLTGGSHPKLIVFKGTRLLDRSLWLHPPESEDMKAVNLPEHVYRTSDIEGMENLRPADELLSKPPFLDDFNLLPPEYKRPDYLRYCLITAVIFNILAILVLGGIKEYKIREYLGSTQSAIAEIRPRAEELQELRIRERELTAAVEELEGIKIDFNLINFLEELTEILPRDSYLDQIRIEGPGKKAVHLQGYTDDISRLTTSLGDLGDVQLRSTRQRQNKIYFHVELNVL